MESFPAHPVRVLVQPVPPNPDAAAPTASPTPPENPFPAQMWLRTTDNRLLVYQEEVWIEV